MKIDVRNTFPVKALRLALFAPEAIKRLGVNPSPELVASVVTGPPPGGLDGMDDWMSFDSHLVDWHFAGRQIFAFESGLLEEFLQTEVDDIPLDLIKVPFRSLYIHFERPLLEIGYDGIWLSHGVLRLTFPDGAIATGLPWDEAAFREAPSPTVGEWLEAWQERQRRLAAQHPTIQEACFKSIESLERDGGKLLRIFINCLCFVEYYREWVNLEWPGLRPALARRVTQNGNPQKAWAHGFNKVYICCLPSAPSASSDPSGRRVGTHWRRGHWRRQAYGPGFTERRLKWIRPAIINPDKGDPNSGHLYIT